MSIPRCPKNNRGEVTCTKKARVSCQSIHNGHHQDCNMASGSWLTCVDMVPSQFFKSDNCQDKYGVNKDSVWVKDGCAADFVGCYREGPSSSAKLRTSVVECSNLENDFKLCPIEGAALVNDVNFKYAINTVGRTVRCSKKFNYGIFNNSMWIHYGCGGIFDVEYYEELQSPNPDPKPDPTTIKTTKTTSRNRPFTVLPPFAETTKSPLTTHRPTMKTTIAGPFNNDKVDVLPIAFAVVCGVLVALLLVLFAALWYCRKNSHVRRCLTDSSDESKTECEMDEISVRKSSYRHYPRAVQNAYEEISPVLEPAKPNTSQGQGEMQPFLHIPKPNNGHEHNNNPPLPLPNNYFILEPQASDSGTARTATFPQPQFMYRPGVNIPVFTDANTQPYAHGKIPHYAQGLIRFPEVHPPFSVLQPTAPYSHDQGGRMYVPRPQFYTLGNNGAFTPVGHLPVSVNDMPQNNLSILNHDDEGYEKCVSSISTRKNSSTDNSVRSDHYDKIKDYYSGHPMDTIVTTDDKNPGQSVSTYVVTNTKRMNSQSSC